MNDKLPDNGGYVAAAYLVFLALLLVYFAVMAIRTSRLERSLQELNQLADEDRRPGAGPAETVPPQEPAGVDA